MEHIFVIERLRDAQSKSLTAVQLSTCVEDMNQEKIINDKTETVERKTEKMNNALRGNSEEGNNENTHNLLRN